MPSVQPMNYSAVSIYSLSYISQDRNCRIAFPLSNCKGYAAWACQSQHASLASPSPNSVRGHTRALSKGSRAKGAGRTELAPDTPHCSLESIQCSIPKLEMHYCKQERCNHLSLTWCLPLSPANLPCHYDSPNYCS